jgi:hypothetical protein
MDRAGGDDTRYFDGEYFDADYFGLVADPPPPPVLAIDVPDAVMDLFLATPEAAWVAGGITEGNIDQKSPAELYVSFHDITSAPTYVAGHPAYTLNLLYQFDCFAPSRHDARRMSELLVDIYHPQAPHLPYAGGIIVGMNAMPGGGMDESGGSTRGGRPLYKFTRDFQFTIARTRNLS